jgi:hypothetical protein
VLSRAISRAKAAPTADAAASQRTRLVTELSDLQKLFDSVVAGSQSATDRVATETAQQGERAPTMQRSVPARAPLEPIERGQAVRLERVERWRGVGHDGVPVDPTTDASVPAASVAAPRMPDAAQEEILLDRLLDRLEERLRDQAIRHLGFTGGLT